MGRYLAGAASAILLIVAGLFLWQGVAQQDLPPPPADAPPVAPERTEIDPMDAPPPATRGPAPPEATELTREQKRFSRYDRNRDNSITRVEMMSTRTPGFRRLDKNGDNYLTFEEWAKSTRDRFAGADANQSGTLTPAEFATTRRASSSQPSCSC